MIGFLKGKLLDFEENILLLDINGVGYEVEMAIMNTIPQIGEQVEIYIYTYVREDAIKLFGFVEKEEKELFIALLTVNGIGPRAALNIVSSMPAERFINAIQQENRDVLKEISGIGPKTASRLILELQGKVEELAVNLAVENNSIKQDSDLFAALNSLGYANNEIDSILRQLSFEDDIPLSEKIKIVLSQLGKGRS